MVATTTSIHLFFGQSPDGYSNATWRFTFADSVWTQVADDGSCVAACPEGSITFNATHCTVLVPLGGPDTYTPIDPCASTSVAPALRDHTATLVDNDRVYILGGSTPEDEFQDHVYVYELQTERWTALLHQRPAFAEVAGHSAVYYAPKRAIYVYGGFRPAYASYGEASSNLVVYNIDDDLWIEVSESRTEIWGEGETALKLVFDSLSLPQLPLRTDLSTVLKPPALAYHSAVLMDENTMVVYGGTDHVHYFEEVCYHYAIYAYHIPCNVWTPATGAINGSGEVGRETNLRVHSDDHTQLLALSTKVTTEETAPVGRTAHGAVAVDNTLYILGGFNSVVRGDVRAFKPSDGWCATYVDGDLCTSSELCGYCAEEPASRKSSGLKDFIFFPSTSMSQHLLSQQALNGFRLTMESTLATSAALTSFPDLANVTRNIVIKTQSLHLCGEKCAEQCAGACLQNNQCRAFTVSPAVNGATCTMHGVSLTCAPFHGAGVVSLADARLYELYAGASAPCTAFAELAAYCRGENGTEGACGSAHQSCVSISLAEIGSTGTAECQCVPGYAADPSGACLTQCSGDAEPGSCSTPAVLSCGSGLYALQLPASDSQACVTATECLALGGKLDTAGAVPTCNSPESQAQRRRRRRLSSISELAMYAYEEQRRLRRDEEDDDISNRQCFASHNEAAAFFDSLLQDSSYIVPTSAFTVSQSSDANRNTTAGRAMDGVVIQTMPSQFCAATKAETQPWWQAMLAYALPIDKVVVYGVASTCQEASCPGAGARINVGLVTEAGGLPSDPTTLCGTVTLPPNGPAVINCGGAVGLGVRITVQHAAGSQTTLGLCEVQVVLEAPGSTPGTNTTGMACGGADDGVWQPGGCPRTCVSLSTCEMCSSLDGCGWCAATGACVALGTDNADADDACPDDDSLTLAPSACVDARSDHGLVRERYVNLGNVWSLTSLLSSDALAAPFPQLHDRITQRFTSKTWQPGYSYGERLHGYVTPNATGEYRFWIRNAQAMMAELYFNSQGISASGATRIAYEPSGSVRPQTLWNRAAVQRSSPITLQVGQRYYIAAVVFVFDSRYYGEYKLDVAITNASSSQLSPTDADIIPASWLAPYEAPLCENIDNCFGCGATANCVWCDDGRCLDVAGNTTCPVTATVEWQRCPACEDYTSCETCAGAPHCEWAGYYCRRESSSTASTIIRSAGDCPRPCHTYSDCSSCTGQAGLSCGWCSSTQTCFNFNGYQSVFSHGACLQWSTSPNQCINCSALTTCANCLENLQCGWLGLEEDGSRGVCVKGDFSGVYVEGVAPELNLTSRVWSYDRCPAVDECMLGYDNCHTNASCTSTGAPYPGGFECVCLDGYAGDGRSCTPVCHGCQDTCVAPNQCQCDDPERWTGANCTNCLYEWNASQETWQHSCGVHAVCLPPDADPSQPFDVAAWLQQHSGPDVPLLSCVCPPGYVGNGLSGCVPVCDTHGCVHGVCTAPDVCECLSGFGGPSCDDCPQGDAYPCSVNATCVMQKNATQTQYSPVCTCKPGYSGSGHHCNPVCSLGCVHGVCTAPDSCTCETGWTGNICDACLQDTSPCALHALCVPTTETAGPVTVCECVTGYTGDGLAGCNPVCENGCLHGTCITPNNCTCDAGWQGETCSSCALGSSVCPGNSSCVATGVDDLNECRCDAGYNRSSDGQSCEPSCSQGCLMGTCVAPDTCSCLPQWENALYANCSECQVEAVGEQGDEDNGGCAPHATCVGGNLTLSLPSRCQCNANYTGTGRLPLAAGEESIEDYLNRTNYRWLSGRVPAEDLPPPGCQPVCQQACVHGSCIGPNECACDVHWGGAVCDACPVTTVCAEVGAVCSKVDTITLSALLDAANLTTDDVFLAHNGSYSGSITGSYRCQCDDGYAGDGLQCQPQCEQGCVNGECVAPNTCECLRSPKRPDRYAWVGPDCSVCAPDSGICHDNATCLSNGNEVGCECVAGYVGDGFSCTPLCDNPCLNGECVFKPGPPWGACECDYGFTGTDCGECLENVHGCHEHADCVVVDGSATCVCDAGYTGDGRNCMPICQTPCVHGTCSAPDTCSCDLGWTGTLCDTDCDCNFHSHCSQGVGQCDTCQHNTMGEQCQTCKPGYFGNATVGVPDACQACQCNQHGDCDSVTGACSCDAVTQGPTCEQCVPGFYGDARDGGACVAFCNNTRNRVALLQPSGWIGSGPNYTCSPGSSTGMIACYDISVACSFALLRPNNLPASARVRLTVTSMETECGYDTITVFDGGSLFAPALGSVSGTVAPPVISSSTGDGLLVHWFSDVGFVLRGFRAFYEWQLCPGNCSGHGTCLTNGTCQCETGYRGEDCSLAVCPDNCNAAFDQGVCDAVRGRCNCAPGFEGEDCSRPVLNGGWLDWQGQLPRPRALHAAAAVPANGGVVYVFGGRATGPMPRTANDGYVESRRQGLVLNDVVEVSLADGSVRSVAPAIHSPRPEPRHSMSLVATTDGTGSPVLYVFGGKLANHTVSGELWRFTVSTAEWQLVQAAGQPPTSGLYGHTATLVGDWMYVIGGLMSDDDGYNQDIWRFNVQSQLWQVGLSWGVRGAEKWNRCGGVCLTIFFQFFFSLYS